MTKHDTLAYERWRMQDPRRMTPEDRTKPQVTRTSQVLLFAGGLSLSLTLTLVILSLFACNPKPTPPNDTTPSTQNEMPVEVIGWVNQSH